MTITNVENLFNNEEINNNINNNTEIFKDDAKSETEYVKKINNKLTHIGNKIDYFDKLMDNGNYSLDKENLDNAFDKLTDAFNNAEKIIVKNTYTKNISEDDQSEEYHDEKFSEKNSSNASDWDLLSDNSFIENEKKSQENKNIYTTCS